jgi:hypothetical protein
VGEFITVGALTLNLAHIVSVEVAENRVYIETTLTTNNNPRHIFHGDDAEALRLYFGRVSTDIVAVYDLDCRYRKIATCTHEFPSYPALSGEACIHCHEDFADIYG